MALKVNIHCSVVSVMSVVTKRLRLEARGLRYKVALYLNLYLNYLYIKFYDEIKGSLRISSIIFD